MDKEGQESFRKFTEISERALKEGQTKDAFGATICYRCELLFLDGVEGNAEDARCDSCWFIEGECGTPEHAKAIADEIIWCANCKGAY